MTGKTVIFLHIPKTAGVTVRHLIQRQYTETEMYYGDHLSPTEVADAFASLTANQKMQFKMVWGHLIFGVHQHLPQKATYFTFLRDPVERTISHYYYILSRPHEFEIARYLRENNFSFHEALEQELILDIQNVQTRMVAGLPYDFPPNTYKEEHLEMAKKNLTDHFAMVGLVERFDESLLLLKKVLSWDSIFYYQKNKTPQRPYQRQIPPETLALIKKENRLDLQLYEFAQQQFAKQLMKQDEGFVDELRRFQFWNHTFYNPLKPRYEKVDGFVRMAYWQMRKVSVREMLKKQFNR